MNDNAFTYFVQVI